MQKNTEIMKICQKMIQQQKKVEYNTGITMMKNNLFSQLNTQIENFGNPFQTLL